MNSQPESNNCGKAVYGVAVIGAFLIVAALVWIMYSFTKPEPLGKERAAERRKTLMALRAENENVLNNYAWQNEAKGIVRLPIEQAMKMAQAAWSKNPAGVRADLTARVDKFNKPVSYE